MESSSILRISLLITLIAFCGGYQTYQANIPNGDKVPNSCVESSLWAGVGHEAHAGGGARNPFGVAFAAKGKTWSKELCEADSDEDGNSNGKELGDPECNWTKGGSPSSTTGLSHPGICEPVTSDKCRKLNEWATGCPTPSGAENTQPTALSVLTILLLTIYALVFQ